MYNFVLSKASLINDQFNQTLNVYGYRNVQAMDLNFNEAPMEFYSTKIFEVIWIILSRVRFLFYFVWPSETMFESLGKVPRYVTEMFPIFFIIAILENAVRILQGKSVIRVNETIGSLSQGVFQECLRIKVRSIEVLIYCIVWDHFRLITLPWDSLWTWWICYIGVDFGFYWAHRIAHEVNFIWAIHQAHHSSEEFSVVSALRQAVLQPFTAWFTYVPLALVVPPQIFLAHLQLSELYMAWIHTEIVDTIGPLEYILNTPSHHRVHHSRNPEYIDKNYGGMLIIWDRFFGTFKGEDKQNPPVYGLVHPVNSFDPIEVQFHTWPVIWRRLKRATCWSNKLRVIFYGPGWKPGLDRLGDHMSLPRLIRPVNVYNPQIGFFKNSYIVTHFALMLIFYHQLTIHHNQFRPYMLNIGVLSLVVTITTLGFMLDNKRRYNEAYELVRCFVYFEVRHLLMAIIDVGIQELGLSLNQRLGVMALINMIFVASIILNLSTLSMKFFTSYRYDNSEKLKNGYRIKKDIITKCKTT